MPGDWIKKLADDERKRDGVRSREVEIATRKADLVRTHGQRLLDELREIVARDVEAFQHEFPGDQTREIVFEGSQPEGGFVVHKPQYPTVSLNVAPRLAAAAV